MAKKVKDSIIESKDLEIIKLKTLWEQIEALNKGVGLSKNTMQDVYKSIDSEAKRIISEAEAKELTLEVTELKSKNSKLEKELVALRKFTMLQKELEHLKKTHPNYPKGMFKQLATIHVEVGKLTKAVLDYADEGTLLEEVLDELVWTAAACMRMFQSL